MATSTLSSPAAASRTPTTVSYEKFAPRSTAQIARLNRIAALTSGPSVEENDSDRHFIMEAMSPPTMRWNKEASEGSETLKKATEMSDKLSQQLKHTISLRLALRASINVAEDISNRHAELIRHSGELSAAADRLQEEESLLTKHAEEIGMPLQHYDTVDRISIQVGVLFKGKSTVRGLAKIKVDDEEFPSMLDEIDDAVDFFGRECGGKEALEAEMKRRSQDSTSLLSGNLEYYRRALALQEAALDLIKEAVVDRIATIATQINSALNTQKIPVQADQLEASLIYTRFYGISSRSNRLLSLVSKRLHRGNAYHDLLQQCRNAYCSNRESLLRLTVRSHMDKLKEQHGPVGMTRLASVFLVRLCTVETSLYLDFFGEKKKEEANEGKDAKSSSLASQIASDQGTFYDSEFQSYLTSLCSSLHGTVRRSLVTMLDLDTLCQVVSVLREERSLASASPTTMAAARAISNVIEDAQERLIFCANSTLTKEVIRFKATPSDLDYPEKLKNKVVPSLEPNANDDEAVEKRIQSVYESWFPPIRSILRILSKIFRVVEPKVFEDMALQSVQGCIRCLKEGSKFIEQRKGVMHSDLFLVKHLLILREQLSPFDIELRSVERQLDFSDAGKAVARFLANRNRRLFSMSTENALITLLREGVSVQESSVDSKRDLEDALRSACNDFIEHTSKSIAGDMLALVEKCKSEAGNALAQKAILTAETVDSLLEKTSETFPERMNDVTSQMVLYLENQGTQNILLKPVNRKITRALEDIKKLTSQIPDGEGGWNPEIREKVLSSVAAIEKLVKSSSKASKAP